jgi:hypothetical protein
VERPRSAQHQESDGAGLIGQPDAVGPRRGQAIPVDDGVGLPGRASAMSLEERANARRQLAEMETQIESMPSAHRS